MTLQNNQESEQVKAIKKRYKESFPEKAATIKAFVDCCESEVFFSASKEKMNDLHEFVHKLAGSSGMYGFDDISAQARALMGFIEDGQQEKIPNQLTIVYNLLID